MTPGLLRDRAVQGCLVSAWLLFAAGWVLPSPVAGFFLAFLAVTCAVLPLAFGTRRQRLSAITALLLGVILAGVQARKAGNDPYFKKGPVLSRRTG